MDKATAIFYGQIRTFQNTLLDSLLSVTSIIDGVYFFIWDYEADADVQNGIHSIMTNVPDIPYEIVIVNDQRPKHGWSAALWYNVLGLVNAIDFIKNAEDAFFDKPILRMRYDIVIEKHISNSLTARSNSLISVAHEWIPSKKIGFDGLFLGYGADLELLADMIAWDVLNNGLILKEDHIYNVVPEIYFFSRANDILDISLLFEKVRIARLDGNFSAPFGVHKSAKDVLRGIYYLLRVSNFSLLNIWKEL